MEETLISFETAKLAKEKGFKLQSNAFGYVTKFYNHNTHSLLPFGRTGRTDLTKAYYASTQGLLQKWLREVHGINIVISPSYRCFNIIQISKYNEIEDQNEDMASSGLEFKDFETYEEALEVGLSESLKFIE